MFKNKIKALKIPSDQKFSYQFRNYLLFFRLFGYCPFSMQSNRMLKILLKFLTIINLFITIGIFVKAFFYDNLFYEQQTSSLYIIVGGLVFLILIIAVVTNLLQSYAKRYNQLEIINIFNLINTILNKNLFYSIDYKLIKRRFLKKFVFILFVLLTIQTVFFIFLYFDFDKFWIYHFLPAFFIRIRLLQNIFYIDFINEILLIVNSLLESNNNNNNGNNTDGNIINNSKQTLGKGDKLANVLYVKEYNYNFNMSNYVNNNSANNNNMIYNKILYIKIIYGKLWDVCNLINDCFGWSLLVITTENFIEFTTNSYWLFLSVEDIIKKINGYHCICALIPIVFLLAILAYSCYTCSQSSMITGGLVHKMDQDLSNDLNNALIREFSLQLIHEPISITANGFFSINFTLLGSMAAAIVTYLVILIQFQLSEKNKKS